ncbi:ribokinase [Bacillus oleivorans]|uniref:Ribokinase n=1 Tax=Bacillus oleivorans TaxID=1448271 RepID=A0A285CHR9_9BACI|nr:ribokinase [Bacillus oleivorans]SNX67144.1 ribokinase [Bacillus oleivorans]
MITVIGSLNIDLVTSVDRYPKLGETLLGSNFQTKYGGKGANQAVAAARLGGTVRMVGCVGSDSYGDDYRSYLQNEGVLVDNVEPVTHTSTGTASITIAEGDNSIIVVPGANFALTPEVIEAKKDAIANSKVILLQLEIPMETVEKVLEIASEHKVITILNPAPFQPIPAHWWNMITYITPNEHEAAMLMESPDFKEEYKEKIIMTNGSKGVVFYQDSKEQLIPAPKVEVVDTTGAGDTFNGAFAYFLHEGKGLDEACRYAVRAASLSVTKFGAQGGMPTLEELKSFMDQN